MRHREGEMAAGRCDDRKEATTVGRSNDNRKGRQEGATTGRSVDDRGFDWEAPRVTRWIPQTARDPSSWIEVVSPTTINGVCGSGLFKVSAVGEGDQRFGMTKLRPTAYCAPGTLNGKQCVPRGHTRAKGVFLGGFEN